MHKIPDPSAAVSPSWLLQRARAKSGLSQAELASRVGVDQSVVSRIESGERGGDFVGVQQLVNHTDYRLVVSLRPAPYKRPQWEQVLTPFKPQGSYLVQQCLPEQLVDLRGEFRRGEELDGPTVGEALYWLGEIADVWHAASLPERRLQDVYRQTRDEQARTLVHTVLHAGEGAAHAHQALGALIDELVVLGPLQERRQRRLHRQATTSARIGRRAWAHVVLSVRAEAWICERNQGALIAGAERYMAEEFSGVAHLCRLLFDQLAETASFTAWCGQEAPPEYLAWLDSDSELTWRDQQRAGRPPARRT